MDDVPQDVIELLLAYLGAELSSEGRDEFELRMLTDDQFSSQVENARVLLLQGYADGSLEPPVERRVRAWVTASPHAQEEVAIERTLRRIAVRHEPSKQLRRSLLILMPLAACLVAALLFPLLRNRTAPNSYGPTSGTHPTSSPTTPQPEQTILLVAQRLRGSLPPGSNYHLHTGAAPRLQIVLPSSHSAQQYRVIVTRAGADRPIANFTNIPVQGTAQAPFLETTLPLHALSIGTYIVELNAPDDSFRLQFRIVK